MPIHKVCLKNLRFNKPLSTYQVNKAMSKRLSAAARTAKSTLESYKAVRQVKERTQQKLDALLEIPFQKFFQTIEDKERHPYYAVSKSGKQLLDDLEALVSGIKDWHIGPDTLGDELEKIKADQIWKEEPEDIDLDHLRAIKSSPMTTLEAAEKFISVINAANDLRNSSTEKHLRSEIKDLYTEPHQKSKVKRVLVSHNIECPTIDIEKECAAAFKATRELGKHLSRCGIDGRTIRDEFETIKVGLAEEDDLKLSNTNRNRERFWVDWYLKQKSN